MARINLLSNDREVRRQLDRLGSKVERRAITRALNRTINGVRTEASRQVRSELNLRAKRVRRDMKVRRARAGQRSAELVIAGRPVPLIEYGARQTKRGVTFRVKKRAGRKRLRHAFIAKMRSGHTGVFSRRIKGGKPVKRLEIDEHFSTALVQFFNDPAIVQRLGTKARDRFGRELQSQIDLALAQRGGGLLALAA